MAQTDIRGKHLWHEENGMVPDQRGLDKTILLLAEKGQGSGVGRDTGRDRYGWHSAGRWSGSAAPVVRGTETAHTVLLFVPMQCKYPRGCPGGSPHTQLQRLPAADTRERFGIRAPHGSEGVEGCLRKLEGFGA